MTEKGIGFESINYIEQRLAASDLKRLLRSAGLKPQEALRTKEAAYRQYVMGRELSDGELLDLMVKHPELIQRPIIARGNKAVLARPASKLADLGIE